LATKRDFFPKTKRGKGNPNQKVRKRKTLYDLPQDQGEKYQGYFSWGGSAKRRDARGGPDRVGTKA